MSEQSKIDAERAEFEARFSKVYDLDFDEETEEYKDPGDQALWYGWKARASLPVGVPDGYALVPVEPSFETRQALYNSGFEAPDNILDYGYRSILGAVKVPVEAYRDDTRKPHELSAAGCRCVRFGEGNPHWPCELHSAKKEQADLVAVWRCRIAGGESYAYFPSKRCRFCEPLYAAPTVKAEQVPTPEFVWVRLLEALSGDNGCAFSASTDDYREAKPALVELITAGFFRDAADSLDGDIWMVAAGEQGEAAASFASCADAYAVLSVVLNRVFDRPEDAHSLPAAGSAVEDEAWLQEWARDKFTYTGRYKGREVYGNTDWALARALHADIVAALSAQQSAPYRVSVLCEALDDARRAMFAVLNQEPRMKAVAKRVLSAEIDRIDRALLASHQRGEA